MRLIGLAALTAVINSEALHNDIGHYGAQVSIILHPILNTLFVTPIAALEERSVSITLWLHLLSFVGPSL